MSSEKSSKININYLDKNGNKLDTKTEIKHQSSDTDFHFNMIANKEKILNLKESESSTDLLNIHSSTSSENTKKTNSSNKSSNISSSKKRIDNLDFTPQIPKTEQQTYAPSYPSTNAPSYPSTNIPNLQSTTNPTYNLNPQEIRMKKIELLRRLSEIKSKGYSLTKEYDFNSSIEEMEYEYSLLKSFADKRNGTKLYKSILLNGISLVEFVNDKYDPFDFKLGGWSEHMSVEIDSYEDIIEEIYEKYKSTGKTTPPEIRLIFLILASGAAFHFTKTQLGGIPGISSMATGALGKMMGKEKKESQFMSPQEINLEKQKQMLKEQEKQVRMNKQSNSTSKMFSNQSKPQVNQNIPNNFNINSPSIPQFKSTSRDIPEIRAPRQVEEILNRIKTIQENNDINTTETQEETTTNNDRLVSESTFSDSKKKGGRKPKKPIISIDTI